MGYESISDVGAVNFIILGDDDNVVQLLNESLLIQEDGMWLTHNLNRGDPANVFTLQHVVVLFQAEGGGVLRISVSTDGGKTFTDPQDFVLNEAVDDALTVQWLNIHGRDIRILFELPPGEQSGGVAVDPYADLIRLPDPEPSWEPTGLITGTLYAGWDAESEYLAVGANHDDPFMGWYRRDGDEFTKLPNPYDEPTLWGGITEWNEDRQYLAFAQSNEIRLYKRFGDDLEFISFADYWAQPQTHSLIWSGDYLIRASYADYGVSAYESGLAVYKLNRAIEVLEWQYRVEIPEDGIYYGESYMDISLHPNGEVLVAVGYDHDAGTGVIRLLDWNRTTGTLSPQVGGRLLYSDREHFFGCSWDSTGEYLVVGRYWDMPPDGNGILWFKWDGSNLNSLPEPVVEANVNKLRWHPYLPLLIAPTSPFSGDFSYATIIALVREGDELVLRPDPPQPTNIEGLEFYKRRGYQVAWSPNGLYLALCHDSGNYLTLYKFPSEVVDPIVILKHHIPYITERGPDVYRR